MLDVMHHVLRPGDEAADAGEALAERPHDQVNVVGQAEVRRRAAPVAGHAHAVRVVHHDARAVFLADCDDLRHRRDVAAHAVDAVNHHQLPGIGGQLAQQVVQAADVAVTEAAHLAAAHQAAIDDAGVIVLVDDHVVALLHQRRDRADVGLVAGREDQRGFLADEFRQPAVEFQMQFQRAVQKARPGDARAIAIDGFLAACRTRGSVVSPR